MQSTRGSMAAHLVAHLDERVAARFWAKVDKNGPVPAHCPELGPCWLWTRATDRRGYGRFGIGPAANCRMFGAHRVAMALTGTIPPDDLFGCHHCDNPPCCNPAHLFLGTCADNCADMVAKGRSGRLAICGNGHIQNTLNTYYYFWRGYWLRRCRACDRERRQRKKLQRSA